MPWMDKTAHEDAPAGDASLVERMRDGDRQAASVLAARYLRAAYVVALAVLGNRHDAEDVAQEAFVVAIERIEDCREPDRFAGWLMTIVRNRSKNLRNALPARRAVPWDDDSLAEGMRGPDPVEDSERREAADRLLAGLATLAERQREVVLLHDLEGWRHAEIGAALGLSEGMSRQHLFAAHRLLRERLSRTAPEGGSDG
jgi:RNA polymerase sigma-70 factor (ECF subfamily)